MSWKIVAGFVATSMIAVTAETASAASNYRIINSPIRVSPQPVPPPMVTAPRPSRSGGPTFNPQAPRPPQFGGSRVR